VIPDLLMIGPVMLLIVPSQRFRCIGEDGPHQFCHFPLSWILKLQNLLLSFERNSGKEHMARIQLKCLTNFTDRQFPDWQNRCKQVGFYKFENGFAYNMQKLKENFGFGRSSFNSFFSKGGYQRRTGSQNEFLDILQRNLQGLSNWDLRHWTFRTKPTEYNSTEGVLDATVPLQGNEPETFARNYAVPLQGSGPVDFRSSPFQDLGHLPGDALSDVDPKSKGEVSQNPSSSTHFDDSNPTGASIDESERMLMLWDLWP